MESSLLQNEADVQALRELRNRLAAKSTVVDFEEQIQLPSIRAITRIWRHDHQVAGFAFVDDFYNLWFETATEFPILDRLETEIIEWGLACLKNHAAGSNDRITLDCTCSAEDRHRQEMLLKHGFIPGKVRTLHYARSLDDPIQASPLPPEYSIRSAKGMQEVVQLVELHRAAFGTDNMTVEHRMAMMNTPQYFPQLDLVAVAPDASLAAFCVCGFDDPEHKNGYTDPIGTHPSHQRIGLGRALVTTGLRALKEAGAKTTRLGTSSDNIPMQKLADALGFVCVSEQLWFSKDLS